MIIEFLTFQSWNLIEIKGLKRNISSCFVFNLFSVYYCTNRNKIKYKEKVGLYIYACLIHIWFSEAHKIFDYLFYSLKCVDASYSVFLIVVMKYKEKWN